jgi:aminopeptidase N
MITTTVKVPKGFNIAANGILKSEKTVSDSTFYNFVSQYPMATYLMNVNASKFKRTSDTYSSKLNPNLKVPLEYYVWEDDWTSDTTNGGAYNAEFSFRNTSKMMDVYAKVFGEYPFEQYGMVSVQPFSFGGMEHQTMTTINRSWLRGWSETGIAHELAHQWLGDMITCATWFDIWINEGGATWSEALWLESMGGKNYYYLYMNQIASRYKSEESIYEIPIYGVPISSIFTHPIYLLEYNKASWVYHMMREQFGEEVFFPAFTKLLEKYKYKSLETIDFLNTLKANIPDPKFDLSIFFEQWLVKAGHPKYVINSTTYDWGSGKSKVTVNLKQVQEGTNVPKLFVAPIEFQFFKDTILTETRTELNFIANQTFEFFLPFYPDSIAINTNKILCDIQENIISVKSTEDNQQLNSSIFPNPTIEGGTSKYNISISGNEQVTISVYNSFGQKVQDIFDGILADGNYEISLPTSSLNSGTFIIESNIGTKKLVHKLIIIE